MILTIDPDLCIGQYNCERCREQLSMLSYMRGDSIKLPDSDKARVDAAIKACPVPGAMRVCK
jgi:ferredoxin